MFSCDGSNTDDVLLAAADRALSDGMDIINMCDPGFHAPAKLPIAWHTSLPITPTYLLVPFTPAYTCC